MSDVVGARPVPRAIVGAAFAACVLTTIPGLTLTLHGFDRTSPDLKALFTESIAGAIAALFGALQIGAQTRRTGWWVGAPILLLLAFYTFFAGVIFVFDFSSGTVDGGPALVLGVVAVLALLVIQAGLGALTWVLLASLTKRVDHDEAMNVDARARCASWLVVAALLHVAIKGVTGGPVVFGLFAAVVASMLAWRAKQTMLLVFGACVLALGLLAQIGARVHYTHSEALARLPQCEQLLPPHVRALPGVADALVFSRSPYPTTARSLVVLPVGGGATSPELRKLVEREVASAGCVIDDHGTKPDVTVEDPKYVSIPVTARVHLDPGADPESARAAITHAIHDAFEPRADDKHLIRDQSARGGDPSKPLDAGVASVEYRSGADYLENRIDQLAIGEVPVIESVDVEILP